MNLQEIINKIKQKKELAGMADSIIEQLIDQYCKKTSFKLENFTAHDTKIIIKDIRKVLRQQSGRFQSASLPQQQTPTQLLASHTSTQERLEFYPVVRQLIRDLKVRSILDIGCGRNPLALATQGVKYYAIDINEHELAFVAHYFKEKKIPGTVQVADARSLQPSQLPKVDLCLLLKVVDLLDQKGHKQAEVLIKKIPARYLLVSFSTKTLSGKSMNHPQRGWIEQLSRRIGYEYTYFSSKNEIFYLITKPAW